MIPQPTKHTAAFSSLFTRVLVTLMCEMGGEQEGCGGGDRVEHGGRGTVKHSWVEKGGEGEGRYEKGSRCCTNQQT